MGYATYVGRVGALAVALGIGAAVANAPGLAWAEPDSGSSSTESSTGKADSDTGGADSSQASAGSASTSSADSSSASGNGPSGESSGTDSDRKDSASDSDDAEAADDAGASDDEAADDASDKPAADDAEPVIDTPSSGLDAAEKGDARKPRRTSLPTVPSHRLADAQVAAPPSAVTDRSAMKSSAADGDDIQRLPDVATDAPEPAVVAATQPARPILSVPAPSPVQPQPIPAVEAPVSSAPLNVVSNVLAAVGFGPLPATGPTGPVGSPLGLAALAWGTRPKFDELLSGDPSLDAPTPVQTSQTVELDALTQAAPAMPELINQTPVTVQNNPAGVVVARNQAYVANQGSNTVSVVDTATGIVARTITVGTAPTAVTASPDERFVYVANSGSGNVTVIDTTTNTVKATVKVGSSPQDVAVNPAGTRLYVANAGSGTVSVINTSTNKVVATVKVGSGPTAVAVNPNGRYVYVACSNGTLAVVDTGFFNMVTKTIQVGSSPKDLAVSPTTGKLFVANAGSNTVSVINMADHTVTSTIGVGSSPTSLALSPDGGVLYAADTTDTLTRIDTGTNTVLGSTPIDTAPEAGAHAVAVRADGRRVYVTDTVERTVRVLAVNSAPVVGGVTVGEPNPDGVVTGSFTVTDADGDALSHTVIRPANGEVVVVANAGPAGTTTYNFTYTPDPTARGQVSTDSFTVIVTDGLANTSVGVTVPVVAAPTEVAVTPIAVGAGPSGSAVTNGLAYVINYDSNDVTVIDTGTNQIVTTLDVGSGPLSVAASETTDRVYVANSRDNTVSVIDATTNTVVDTIEIEVPRGYIDNPEAGQTVYANMVTELAVSPDGARLYVNATDGSITVIDTADDANAVIRTVQLGRFNDLKISPDGTKLYGTPGVGLTVIDTATMTPVSVQVGPVWDHEVMRAEFTNSTGNIAVSPDGKRVYVAYSATIVERGVGGSTSGSFITDAQGRTWKITGEYGAVSVIDTDPASPNYNKEIAQIIVPNWAQDLVVSGTNLYVTTWDGKSVTVIDTTANAIVDTIDTDQTTSGGRGLWVYHYYEWAPEEKYPLFSVAAFSRYIIVDPDDGTVYVTDYWDGTVYALSSGSVNV
jgi:YVTN family beta-propeller protein